MSADWVAPEMRRPFDKSPWALLWGIGSPEVGGTTISGASYSALSAPATPGGEGR
jgi:hypothetical protein